MSILTDLATLVKAGFTFDQIKELQQGEKIINEKPEEKPEKKAEATEKPEDEIDYKAKFEEAEAKLKKLQEEASREDVSYDDLKIDEVVKGIANRLR